MYKEPGAQRPPPPTITIVLASALILAILILALPAIVSIVRPPSALIIPPPATIPTAIVVPTPLLAATDSPSGPPAGVSLLPATMPAGATADDRMFTVYAGWPYQDTGNRQGDSCELQIWPYGNASSDRWWVDCSLVGR